MVAGYASVCQRAARLGTVLAFFLASFPALSADEINLHFAGFAFSGNAIDIPKAFPQSNALLGGADKTSLGHFNKLLVDRLRQKQFGGFKVSLDLGDYKKGDSLALALVLGWENVAQEKLGGVNKISVNLQAQAMLFDFESKQVIANFPFGATYIDATNAPISDDRIRNAVAVLYGDQPGGMVDGFIDALGRMTPKKAYGARIQITQTSVAPEAAATLESAGMSAESAATLLASAFERYLSMNGRIPVLPQTKGQAIGGVMSARFANGDVYNLQLPAPDFQISLNLTNIRKVELSRTGSEVAWAYASYLEPSLVEPLSGAKYLDAAFKFAVVKVISVNGELDDMSSFQESLLSISDQVTSQFGTPNQDWLKKWGVRGAEPGAMAGLSQILNKCR
jgi:hypothetical protein